MPSFAPDYVMMQISSLHRKLGALRAGGSCFGTLVCPRHLQPLAVGVGRRVGDGGMGLELWLLSELARGQEWVSF